MVIVPIRLLVMLVNIQIAESTFDSTVPQRSLCFSSSHVLSLVVTYITILQYDLR